MLFVAANVQSDNISPIPEAADGVPQNSMNIMFSVFCLKTIPYSIVVMCIMVKELSL